MYSIVRNSCFTLLLLLLTASAAISQGNVISSQALLGREGDIVVNAELENADLNFQAFPTLIESTRQVRNMIWLGIDEESPYMLQSDFEVSLQLAITAVDAANNSTTYNRTLTVNYKKDEGTPYKAMAYHSFFGKVDVTVKVLSITSNVAWDVTKVLKLRSEIDPQRDWIFNCSALLSGFAEDGVAGGEWKVKWNAPTTFYAGEYDLEWAWIDNAALANYMTGGNPDPVKIFEQNATRVTVTKNDYKIPLLYDDTGRIYVRVRPAQLKLDGQRIEGTWTYGTGGSMLYYAFDGHQNNLNWQATTTFAEEGKRKSVVQYFDGSLRGRQTVTKDNTTDSIVVAETMYDYQGRPVIQVMPVPSLSNMIAFTKNFNSFSETQAAKSVYDKLDNATACTVTTPGLLTNLGKGAAYYYSTLNPEKNTDKGQFIPDAGGYPFTETRYTNDGTGRVDAQGGVGAVHQVNGGHDTKYYYESPTQTELDALFGTDAGYASHYSKNWVRDANGQYSVAYVDMTGKTVATALAGPVPANLQALPSAAAATKEITRQLIDPETNNVHGRSIISSKALVVPEQGAYTFDYSLTPANLQLENCNETEICYDCLYELRISVLSDCEGTVIPGLTNPVVQRNFTLGEYLNNCNSADTSKGFGVNFTVTLPEGSYTIVKELVLSAEAQTYYRDSVYLPNNACKSLQDFIDEQYDLAMEQADCNVTCASCNDKLGTLQEFTDAFAEASGLDAPTIASMQHEIDAAYLQAKKTCEEICRNETTDGFDEIRSLRDMMLADVTPPYGQYARPEDKSKPYNIFNPIVSGGLILPAPYQQPKQYDAVNNSVAEGPYLNEYGVADNEFTAKARAGQLTPEQFAAAFRSSFAEQLLPHHPEYCKLLAAENNLKSSFQFAADMEETTSWDAAVTAGYVANIINLDPFFQSGAPGYTYRTEMLQKMNTQYTQMSCGGQTKNLSIWQIAQFTVLCRKQLEVSETVSTNGSGCLINSAAVTECMNSLSATYPTIGGDVCTADRNKVWEIFRSIYLSQRREIMSRYLDNPSINCQGTQKVSSTVLRPAYQPRFTLINSTGNNPNWTELNDLLTNGTNPAYYNTEPQKQGEEICKANAGNWMWEMRQCPELATWIAANGAQWTLDSVALNTQLVGICKQGYDYPGHPFGASSIPPGGTTVSGHSNFADVIRAYLTSRSITISAECHPYLITYPAAYEAAPAVVEHSVITKPSNCDCERISTYKQEWEANAPSMTFTAYLQAEHGTVIDSAKLQLLMDLCEGRYACNFLEEPVKLPAIFQCRGNAPVAKTCIECVDLNRMRADFRTEFHQSAPVIDPQTDADIALNKAFALFANNRTGFTKLWTDYAAFFQECIAVNDTVSTGTGCDDLRTIAAQYKLIKQQVDNAQSAYGFSITPIFEELRWGMNGLLEWKQRNSNGRRLSSRYTYAPTNYGLNNKFYKISYTPYSYSDSLFNIVLPLNLKHWDNWGGWFNDMLTNQVVSDTDFVGLHTAIEKTRQYHAVSLMEEWGRFRYMMGSENAWKGDVDGCTFASLAGYYGVSAPDKKFLVDDICGDISNGYTTLAFYPLPERIKTVTQYQAYLDTIYYKVYKLPGTPGNFDDRLPDYDLKDTLKTTNFLYQTEDIKRVVRFYLDTALLRNYYETSAGYYHLNNGDFVMATLEMVDGSTKEAHFWGYPNLQLYKSFVSPSVYQKDCLAGFTWYFYSVKGVWHTTEQIQTMYAACGVKLPCDTTTGPRMCGLNAPVYDDPAPGIVDSCTVPYSVVVTTATEKYELYLDSLRNAFDAAYQQKCYAAKELESFTVTNEQAEHHYTLYYYDHAGNLLKTVPPEGVHPEYGSTFLNNVRSSRSSNGSAVVPAHTLTTNYRYNTLNQVIAQISPDGGKSEFWYDVLGRLVVSQNAKQKNAGQYSYTVYDQLGRISEVGEMTNATTMNPVIARSPSSLADWMHTKAVRDVTVTSYDMAYGESPSDPEGILAGTVLTQRNLRNRVSWSAIYDNGTFGGLDLGDHASATFYTYDIHGNVDTLVQDYFALFGETDFSRFKKMVYDYDLISGKVNQVAYQRGRPDQFYHRYNYDAENRLTGVQTSHDGWVWESEANYDYYKHGPLARTVIGQQQVQGIDYAYTVQGWIKGVNGTQVGDGTYDMGEDGKTGSAHSKVARDAYGFSLNYYSGSPWSDYHAIGATGNKFASVLAALSTNAKSLYNGNIAAMAVNIRGVGDAKLYNYKYDQLNRIVEMDAYAGLQTNNTWIPVASDDYKERVSYDANGNILTYLRNGATAVNGLAMDSLTYQYGRNSSGQLINNRLRYVHDRVADNAYTEDIDSQTPLTLSQVQAEKLDAQTTDNYQYDEIGNLIKDTKEGITAIEWNVYGKIKSITKGAMTITYTYDAAGNRISKEVAPASGPTRKTYYVRDATGNVMSVYEEGGLVNDGNLTQAEVHLYGSSRLGIFKPDVDMTSLVATDVYGYDRGKKFFELSNHLGNVLVTVTDRKNGVAQSVDTTLVDYYLPDVASANDYYPFGMTMPGRSNHSDKYRYGFNGQEKSTEIDQHGNSMTAEYWQYDARLGRRWNVDPRPSRGTSAFSTFLNSPLFYRDPLGDTTINGEFHESQSNGGQLNNVVIHAPTKRYHKPIFKTVESVWDKEKSSTVWTQSQDLAKLVYKESELYKEIQKQMPELPSLPSAESLLREYAGKDLSKATDLLLKAKDQPILSATEAGVWALSGKIHPIIGFGINTIVNNIIGDINRNHAEFNIERLDMAWNNTAAFSQQVYGANRIIRHMGDYIGVISVTQRQMSEIMHLKFFIPDNYSSKIIGSRNDIPYNDPEPPRFHIYFNRLAEKGFLHISEVGISPINF
jgi:YD repeat-containing protein